MTFRSLKLFKEFKANNFFKSFELLAALKVRNRFLYWDSSAPNDPRGRSGQVLKNHEKNNRKNISIFC